MGSCLSTLYGWAEMKRKVGQGVHPPPVRVGQGGRGKCLMRCQDVYQRMLRGLPVSASTFDISFQCMKTVVGGCFMQVYYRVILEQHEPVITHSRY